MEEYAGQNEDRIRKLRRQVAHNSCLQDELENQKKLMSLQQNGIEILKEENKAMLTALNELYKESEDLMDFCIDRGHLDNEDLTDGQISFNKAMEKAKAIILKHNNNGR